MDKVVSHPQVQAREMITRIAHRITGEVEVPGVPIKLSETPGSVDTPAPSLGEHTGKVLTDLLKMHPDEVKQLRRDGVI